MEKNDSEDLKNVVMEDAELYQKAERNYLENALSRTHTQRFEFMVELIKTGIMLKNAKITHKPYPPTVNNV